MSENENKNSSNKDFIEEKIKSKRINKKQFLIRLLLTLIIAAAAACVAAFVFVNMLPVAEKISGREPVKEKISITGTASESSADASAGTETDSVRTESTDVKADSTGAESTDVKADSADVKADSAETSSESSADKGEPEEDGKDSGDDSETKKSEQVPSDGSADDDGDGKEDEPKEIIKEEIIYKELTIDDYIALHEKMAEKADDAQRSIVSVTGITSMLDYFDNTYENSQQLTGVIVADSGEELYILTGYSVLENVERIQVTFADGFIADAYFLRHDPDTGLAVIKVNDSNIPEETMNAIHAAYFSTLNNTRAGERIMAIGSLLGYNHSITYGTVISTSGAYSASDCEYDLISTDIGAGPNSSGIIMNLRGSVTGIIIPPDKTGSENSVTAFAVEDIKSLIESLSNNESRPYIGICGMDVTDSIAERSGVAKGILITSIEDESPAMLAGIMDHDILVRIGDTPVMTMEEYETALAEIEPGSEIHMVTMRMGNEGYTEVEFDVTVGEI